MKISLLISEIELRQFAVRLKLASLDLEAFPTSGEGPVARGRGRERESHDGSCRPAGRPPERDRPSGTGPGAARGSEQPSERDRRFPLAAYSTQEEGRDAGIPNFGGLVLACVESE